MGNVDTLYKGEFKIISTPQFMLISNGDKLKMFDLLESMKFLIRSRIYQKRVLTISFNRTVKHEWSFNLLSLHYRPASKNVNREPESPAKNIGYKLLTQHFSLALRVCLANFKPRDCYFLFIFILFIGRLTPRDNNL